MAPGRSTGELLLACARRATTQRTYGGAAGSLIKYCTVTQLAAAPPSLSYFPASQATIIGWLGSLFDGDSLHHSSLKVYCSAMNQFMADTGFSWPCLDHQVQLARKSFKPLEAQCGGRV